MQGYSLVFNLYRLLLILQCFVSIDCSPNSWLEHPSIERAFRWRDIVPPFYPRARLVHASDMCILIGSTRRRSVSVATVKSSSTIDRYMRAFCKSCLGAAAGCMREKENPRHDRDALHAHASSLASTVALKNHGTYD